MSGPAGLWARAAGAAALLVAVVAGVPVLLVRTAAGLNVSLVPSTAPTWDQVRAAVLTPDTSMRGALVVLFAVMWVIWAVFTASTAREAVTAIRSRGRRGAAQLPRLDALGRPAAQLVAVIALAFASTATAGAAATAATPAAAVTAAHLPGMAAGSVTGAGSTALDATPAPHGITTHATPTQTGPPVLERARYAVQRRDTLWSIAEHQLGDPMRWRELAALNPAAVGPAPDFLIRAGATLLLPEHTPDHVPGHDVSGSAQEVVHRGDTLSQIAFDHGTSWRTIWPVNAGRAEPGGRHLVNPDHIEPGWTIDLPTPETPTSHPNNSEAGHSHADAAHPSAEQPVPAHASPAPTNTRQYPPALWPAATGHNEPAHTGSTATAPAGPVSPRPAGTPTAPTSPTAPATSGQPGTEHETEPTGQSAPAGERQRIEAFAGGGAVLAGVAWLAVARARRRQFRNRRPGRAVAAVPPGLSGVEREVLTVGAAASVDVTWLDRALRSLVQTLAAREDARLPDVLAVRMTDDTLELVLTGASPAVPAPWVADDTGTRWSVHRDDDLPYDSQLRAYHFAPYPTLASVGYTAAGERWLVDLERVGALALTGDRDACLGLARFIAAELALNPWSEMLQVTLVGFGAEMAQANPDRLSYVPTAQQALNALNAQVRDVGDATRDTGVDVLTGRLRNLAGDAWAPHVVLVAPQVDVDPDTTARLLEAMRDHRDRTTVALVLADHPTLDAGARWQVSVDADRQLAIPPLGLELTAQHLPADEAAAISQLSAAVAATHDQPAGPARGDQPWDEYADAAGNLVPADGEPRAAAKCNPTQHSAVLRLAGDEDETAQSPVAVSSVLPLATPAYLERAATTADDLQTLAPAVREDVSREVQDADPGLDADLADWADPNCTRPKVSLLGPVTVRAQGTLPARNPRLAWNTELVAYLATRPRGVTTERLGTDLWPGDPDIAAKTKLRQAVLIARKWLGSNPRTGSDYLPSRRSPGTELYRVEDALVDAELFRRLRLRGVTRGADGITDLHAALGLVTGPPFDPDHLRAGGYGWLAETHLDHEYTAMVVDVAHIVATHHLASSKPDPAAAGAAAKTAVLAGSLEDVPLLDLVAACDALGNRAEADAYVQRILANHDAEVEEDLPPRTAEVLFRRQWLPTNQRRERTG